MKTRLRIGMFDGNNEFTFYTKAKTEAGWKKVARQKWPYSGSMYGVSMRVYKEKMDEDGDLKSIEPIFEHKFWK